MRSFFEKYRGLLSIVLTVTCSVFLVAFVVSAATTIGANINTAGTLQVDGSSTLGDASTDKVNATAAVHASSTLLVTGLLTPYGGISTSTLDNMVIGLTTAALGRFTTLAASTTLAVGTSGTTNATSTIYHGLELGNRTGYAAGVFNIDTLGNVNASGTLAVGGLSTSTLNGVTIGASTAAAGTFSLITGQLATSTWYASVATTTLDGKTIGLTTAALGRFTTLAASTTLAVGTSGTTDATSTIYHGLELGNRTGYAAGVFNIDTLGNVNASGTLAVRGLSTSTLDNVVIGGSTTAAGSFTTVTASGLISGPLATSTWYASVATTTLDSTVIGGTTKAAGSFTTVTATGATSLQKTSSTLLSTYDGLDVGTTATSSIRGQTTSTIAANMRITKTAGATSTLQIGSNIATNGGCIVLNSGIANSFLYLFLTQSAGGALQLTTSTNAVDCY